MAVAQVEERTRLCHHREESEVKMTDWEAQNDMQIDKLIPPPFGTVIITEQGLVLMCKGTYKMLSEGKKYEEVDYDRD